MEELDGETPNVVLTEGGDEIDEGAGVAAPEAAPAGVTPAPVAKVPYTPEELDLLLSGGGEGIDTDRLSPEGKLLMKSFQRGYGSKFEELAAEKRKLAETQTVQADPKRALYQAYRSDPVGVIGEINAEIAKLLNVPHDHEHYQAAQQKIYDYQVLKDELRERQNQETMATTQATQITERVYSEIRKAIPDFDAKEPKLTQFAVSKGLTMEELGFLTDPVRLGSLAAKVTKLINEWYDKETATVSAASKVKKGTPAPLVTGNVPSSEVITDPSKLPYSEYAKRRREGKL
jgi:hypothetical protein